LDAGTTFDGRVIWILRVFGVTFFTQSPHVLDVPLFQLFVDNFHIFPVACHHSLETLCLVFFCFVVSLSFVEAFDQFISLIELILLFFFR